MSYITGIFERAEIQHIREYILNGGDLLRTNPAPYEQRLSEGLNKALGMARAFFPEDDEQMENSIIRAVSAYEDVYMEIGLQVGIRLATQLFNCKGV